MRVKKIRAVIRFQLRDQAETLSVKVKSPPPDAIVTEALTMPYVVAIVPVGEEESLKLNLSENWMSVARNL